MFLTIWKDPVWSKVIAVAIISAFVFVSTYLIGAWPSIFQFSIKVYAFLIESTMVTNWLIALLFVMSFLFITGLLLKLKNKIFNSNLDLKLINTSEEQMLISMAKMEIKNIKSHFLSGLLK